MTLDQVIAKYQGRWENGVLCITDGGGYIWTLARGTPEEHELTNDGRRFVSASVVVTTPAEAAEKRKRGRKPATVVASANE